MKKLGIGAVALGTGLVLVLGGTGSTAYWQVVREAPAVELNTGILDLTPKEDRWTVNGNVVTPSQGNSARPDISGMRLVPGTTIVWEQEYFLERVGTDLAVEISLDLGGIVGSGANSATADEFTVTSMLSNDRIAGGDLSDISFADPTELITEVTGNGYFTLTVEITWPFGNLPTDPALSSERTLSFEATSLTARQVTGEN